MREGSSDTGRIERELDHTRSRLDATIGALQHKLAPKEMVDQAVTYFMEGGGVEFRNNLGRSVRDNPVPVALIGIGVGWLILSGRRDSDPGAAREPKGYRRDDRFRPAAGYDDPYRRYSGVSYPGLAEAADVSSHQPMPYEAAAHDDLATKADEAGRRVERHEGEGEDSFQERVHAARGAVLGLTRDAGEAAASFRDRVEGAVNSAAERVRSMVSGAGTSASHLLDRGQSYGRDLYSHGRSAAASVRDSAGDAMESLGDRPLVLGALGVTVGAVIGMLVPPTRYERRLGASVRASLHDTVREAASEAGQGVARVAESVLHTAHDAARREGLAGTDAPGLASEARGRVADLAGRARHVVEETAAAGRESLERELAEGNGKPKAEHHVASAGGKDQPGGHAERRGAGA